MTTAPAYPAPLGLLKGKTVVVTAAAGTGIGFSAAKRAAEEGARVLMSDFHERRLGEAADRIAAELGTRPATFVCDVTDQEQVDGLRDAALRELDHIDVLINNAGLGGEVSVINMTDEQWFRVLDVTLTSVMRMTRAFLPAMAARKAGATTPRCSVGGRRKGRRIMPPPRPGSWPSRAAPPSRPPSTACGSMPLRHRLRCTRSSPK
jgi:3-oxoacyl-[acyl-carrier protein] reductase